MQNSITMKRIIFFTLFLSIFLTCSKGDPIQNIEDPEEIEDNTEDNDSDEKTDIFFTHYTDSGNKDTDYSSYWGTAQKTGAKLMDLPLSADRPVIDIERVFAEEPDFFTKRKIFSSESYSFFAADPAQFVQITSLGEKGINELLPADKLYQPGRVFAEVVNERVEAAYRSMSFSTSREIIAEKYLLPEFLDKLYHNSIDKVIDDYGPYLLMNFATGFKIVTFYTGLYHGEASDSEKRKAFSDYITDINHKEETVDKDGTTVSQEYIYTDKKNKHPNITEVELSIQNIGGSGEFSELKHLKKVEGIKVHLTPWAQTFNEDNQAVIVTGEQGLLPLYDFLLEENFKQTAQAYIDEGKTPPVMQEPRVEIVKQNDGGNDYLHVYLVTRFGDNVLIDSRLLSPEENVDQLVEAIQEEKQKIFRLSFVYKEAKPSETINAFSFSGIDEKKMNKFVRNGITYLYYREGTKRYAFSVYDEQIMDAYGIREWVNNMEATDKLYSHNCIFIGL